MSELSSKTILCFDHGFGLPIARKLAESFGRVLYYCPWEKAFPTVNESVIGDGFGEIEKIDDFWKVKNDMDAFMFTDIYHEGLQEELRSQGFPVWSSGAGMNLEIDREFFLKKLKELGLDVPKYKIINGLTNLRLYLKNEKDKYIKVSKYRGSFETTHWRSWEDDEELIDTWNVRFGGIKEQIPFLVFEPIDTKLELGCDTYCIDGKWPSLMLHGLEAKDSAYLSAVTKREKMPEELTHIMDAFSPYLKQVKYRCQWSMEVRVTETQAFFIDATTRLGLPSTASQIELWKNFGEIVWYGAHGELVEPEPSAKFSAECMVKIKGEKGSWASMKVPDKLKRWLKLSDCCEVDGRICFPSDENEEIEEVGWLLAIGDTPTKVAEQMNKNADLLPDGCDAAVEDLASIIREVEAADDQNIKFTDQPMPPAEIVLEESAN